MKKKMEGQNGFSLLKWAALLVFVFVLSLPVTAKDSYAASTYTVVVDKGYLALRTAKAYDSRNEIGELYTGDTVDVTDTSDSTYWYVYSPKYGKSGYVNRNYLVGASNTWTVSVSKGYLALRTAKAYDSRNEIGELYTGDTVQVTDTSDGTYWYVYSPKHGRCGYVNRDYLVAPSLSGDVRTVSVSSGYLALRTAKAYDSANEIGELYTGDVVQLVDTSDSTYWYVYSPKHNRNGYVNRNYLTGGTVSYPTYTVSVSKGYLALRTAKAYDASNEIGELYTGDTVQVIDSSDNGYWYVYSPKLNKNGYVNRNYLTGGTVSYPTYTVSVSKGYLALRTAKAYDASNEIGELYTGDTVQVIDSSDNGYWYVYSPKLNKNGYVNRNYLY